MTEENTAARAHSDAPTTGDSGDGASRSRRVWWVVVPIVVLLAGGAAFVVKQIRDVTDAPYQTVTYTVPDAPRLVAASGEFVYRIDPTRSSLEYRVDEKIVGAKASTAVGKTNGIAGDIAVNTADPAESRIGKIVANIEQFHSDNRLRDARIRSDFLVSHEFPLATFTVSKIDGLSGPLTEGVEQEFTIVGDATVRGVTRPVTWKAVGTLGAESVSITATTKIELSDFDIEHVSIAGLVSASNDATLTLDLVAIDPAKATVPDRIDGPQTAKASGKAPSFSSTIKPILEDHCAACHEPGAVGATHWELETAKDASSVAEGLATVTQAKYMPPWPASDVGVPLDHMNTLDKAQIQAIADWARGGGPLDVAPDTKVVPTEIAAGLVPRSDVELRLPAPYTGDPSKPNDYRCFILDPKITEPTYLSGYSFLADVVPQLHHAQVFLVSDAQKKDGLRRSGEDGQPGWQCFGTINLEGKPATAGFSPRSDVGFAGQSNLVAGWVPGQLPVVYPLKSAVMLEPGDALVLQIHYHFDDKVKPDQSGLALQLDPASKKTFKKVRVVNPLGPVEIPCAPGVDAPLCDRDAALAENVRLYGGMGAGTEEALLRLCGHTAEELAARFDGQVASSDCTGRVPEDGLIYGVLGHMHTIGKSFRLTLDPGTPQEKILLDIPAWNFDWQMNYKLKDPIHVKAGDKIRMDCSWDRSLAPNRAPKYIVFADGTEDEMCFGTYAMIPDDQS